MVCLTTIILGALMPKFIKFFLGDPHEEKHMVEGEGKDSVDEN